MDIYPGVELLDHIVTLENPAVATGRSTLIPISKEDSTK